MTRKTGILLALFLLLCGGCTYLLWRPESLLMFRWITLFGAAPALEGLRLSSQALKEILPSFVLYNLPDGLWLLSLLIVLDHLLPAHPELTFRIGLGISLVSLGAEIAQFFFPRLGTFDRLDLLSLGVASLYLFKIAWPHWRTLFSPFHSRKLGLSKRILVVATLGIYSILAAGSNDVGPDADDSKAHCTVQNRSIDGDVKAINNDLDFGYTIKMQVTNTGETGAIKVQPWLSTSEGQWNRTQNLNFQPNQSMDLEYFFQEPTVNATNIQYGVKCTP